MSSDTSLTPSQLFAERLKQAMRDAGLPEKPSVLQARFNEHYDGDHVSWQTARNWLKGNFIPQHDKLRAMAEMLHVKPNYLLFDAPPPQSIQGDADDPTQPLSSSPGDLSMWENYLGIEPEMQQVVRHVVSLMKNLQQLQEWKQTWEIGPIYVFFERFKKLLDDLDASNLAADGPEAIANAIKAKGELEQEWDEYFDSFVEKIEQQLKQDMDAHIAAIFKNAAQKFKEAWNEYSTQLFDHKLDIARRIVAIQSAPWHILREQALADGNNRDQVIPPAKPRRR